LKIQSMDEEKLGKYERKHEGAYNAGWFASSDPSIFFFFLSGTVGWTDFDRASRAATHMVDVRRRSEAADHVVGM
jgi:hypothetical protein